MNTMKPSAAEIAAAIAEAAKLPQFTDEEIAAQVADDADAAPIRSQKTRRVRVVYPVPNLKAMRTRLGLTQEAFAATFSIPVANIRDWEQGRSRPDTATAAYLRVIEREPEAVRRALTEPA